MVIDTPRLRLRCWKEDDRGSFAAMHADPKVMHDYGGPVSKNDSDEKFERYAATFHRQGFCRWALETREGKFLGCVGIMPSQPDHVLGPHVDIGWRLVQFAWGRGYATEAAQASLKDAFNRLEQTEIIAYTTAGNTRSQAVISRLQMLRDPSRDFTQDYESIKGWQGLVWVARPDMFA